MALSKDQLQNIRQYLQHKDLVQVDLQHEVLDHMATAIEQGMQSEDSSFEEAFQQERNVWNNALRPDSNWLLGLAFQGPKLLIDRCVSLLKRFYLLSILPALLLAVLVSISVKYWELTYIQNALPYIIHIGYKVIFFLFGLILFLLYKMCAPTVYSYLLKKQLWGFLPFFLAYVAIGFDKSMQSSDIFVLFALFIPITAFFSLIGWFARHQRAIKNVWVCH